MSYTKEQEALEDSVLGRMCLDPNHDWGESLCMTPGCHGLVPSAKFLTAVLCRHIASVRQLEREIAELKESLDAKRDELRQRCEKMERVVEAAERYRVRSILLMSKPEADPQERAHWRRESDESRCDMFEAPRAMEEK